MDDRVIVVTFWKLRQTRVFGTLYPDLADNWVDDMREQHGANALDYTVTTVNVNPNRNDFQ